VGNGLPFQKAKIYKVDMHCLEKNYLHPLLVGYQTHNWCKMISKSKIMHAGICLICYGDYIDILFIAMVIYFLYVRQVIV
jgi:hypothetical protein